MIEDNLVELLLSNWGFRRSLRENLFKLRLGNMTSPPYEIFVITFYGKEVSWAFFGKEVTEAEIQSWTKLNIIEKCKGS